MNQKLDMFLIGMLGDNFGGLDNDVQALLKPTHIRSQSDEMLEIGVAQNTVGNQLKSNPKYQRLEPIYTYLALFNPTNDGNLRKLG